MIIIIKIIMRIYSLSFCARSVLTTLWDSIVTKIRMNLSRRKWNQGQNQSMHNYALLSENDEIAFTMHYAFCRWYVSSLSNCNTWIAGLSLNFCQWMTNGLFVVFVIRYCILHHFGDSNIHALWHVTWSINYVFSFVIAGLRWFYLHCFADDQVYNI